MKKTSLPDRFVSLWRSTWRWCAGVPGLAALAVAQAPSPSLLPDHASYYAGANIVITFANGPGNRRDWIGIYPEGTTPGSVPSTRWYYVDGTQTGNVGLREGTVTFAGGLNLAGTWTAYLLLNDGYTVLASNTFTVVDPGWPLVQTDRRVYTTGEPVQVRFFAGPGNPKDWIGIYKAGQTPGGGPSATRWSYVDGTQTGTTGLSEGTVTFASGLAQPGDYVAFFLANDGYDVLAYEPFTVTAPIASTPRLVAVQPAPGAGNQPPNTAFAATIRNGTTRVSPATVELRANGQVVAHQFSQQNDLVTISYQPTALWPSGTTHTFTLRYADDATPANEFTHTITFTVGTWRNIVLPAPLYFEDFDSTPEGQLPPGWTSVSYTDVRNPDLDLGNLDSASYAHWVVVAADRFTGAFVTYSNPDNPDGWETDYQRVLSVNPFNVLNGQVFDRPLARGRFVFGNSGYRNGQSQVLYLFTPDFDLTGKTDVHLAFFSLWEQNQDSLAAVEYSVDRGQTWLPIAYFLDGPDIVRVTNAVTGEITVDAVATFTTERPDIARYVDPVTFEEKGGTYGAFIGAAVSPDLAPYIQARVNDDPVESKRIELYRLPQADNRPAVRFRFAHAGTDSWYFGLDNFGLYTIPPALPERPRLSITRTGNTVTLSWPADASGFVLETTSDLATANWTPVGGVSGNSIALTTSDAVRFFRLRR